MSIFNCIRWKSLTKLPNGQGPYKTVLLCKSLLSHRHFSFFLHLIIVSGFQSLLSNLFLFGCISFLGNIYDTLMFQIASSFPIRLALLEEKLPGINCTFSRVDVVSLLRAIIAEAFAKGDRINIEDIAFFASFHFIHFFINLFCFLYYFLCCI